MAGEGTVLRCNLEQAITDRRTAAAAKTKGDTDVDNDIVIVWLDDIESGAVGGICVEAPKVVFPKTAALLINAGERVYWNDAAKKVTKTAADRAIGYGISRDDNVGVGGAAADSDVWVRFIQEVESTTY